MGKDRIQGFRNPHYLVISLPILFSPMSQAFRVQHRRSRRRGYLVLPAHTGTPNLGTLSGSPQFFLSFFISS